MEHITFFVDPAWRRPDLQHTPLLYPFWGNTLTTSTPFWRELFNKYSYDTRYYSITNKPEDADMVLMPYNHSVVINSAPDLLRLCASEAHRQGKPLLIDGLGDIEYPITPPNTIVLRYGGYQFSKQQNEVQIPCYADDLLEIYRDGALQLHQKKEKPVIGFAGWASLPFKQEFRALVKELPTRLYACIDARYGACKKGIFFRRQAIAVLTASTAIVPNFIIRSTFSANASTIIGDPEQLRREFVENLLASDYGLCVRGDANSSVRLFETLSLGRIPIIVDTECIFPFADKVDYREFSLIIDFRDIKRLPDIVAEFHAKLTDDDFRRMQEKARAAYLNYFRVDAVMPHLLGELAKQPTPTKI